MSLGLIIKLVLVAAVVLAFAAAPLIKAARRLLDRPAAPVKTAGELPPEQIHLEALPQAHWVPPRAVAQRVHAFRGLGFRVIGQYRVPELRQLRLVALGHPEDYLAAVVYQHDRDGVTCDAIAYYRHGGTLTVTTSANEGLPARSGHEKIFLPRAAAPQTLYETLVDKLEAEELMPVHPKNFTGTFEKAFGEYAAWRRQQAGPRVVVLRDRELDALSTPLFQRLHARDVDGVKDFLGLGFSPEGRDHQGRTALMVAVTTGELALVSLILGAGADPNARAPGVPGLPAQEATGESAGNLAQAPGEPEALITPLTLAIETGVPEVTSALLSAGAILLGPGDPPLHFAAQEGDIDMVRAIVEAGAGVDLTDDDGATALHYAAMYGHAEVVEYLVSVGADVHARFGKETAIVLAAQNGAVEVVELLELYARPKQARKARRILEDAVPIGNVRARRLAVAAALGRAPMIRKLLASGLHPDLREHEGEADDMTTALMLATQGGHVEAMRILIDGGADVNAVDERGEGVISRAVRTRLMEGEAHRAEAIRLLVRHGVDLSSLDEEDRSLVERCVTV